EWKPNSKNKNLTIRITKSDKILYNNLAWKNHTSVSNWAYQILHAHRFSYGKVEDIDKLLEGLETVADSYDYILGLLDTKILELHFSSDSYGEYLLLFKSNLILIKSKVISLINRIGRSKLT